MKPLVNFPLLAYRYLTQVWKWLASSPLAALRVFCLVESCALHVSHPYPASLLPLPGHLFGLLETKQKQNPPAHRPSRRSRKAVRLALHQGSHCDFWGMAEGRVAPVSVQQQRPWQDPRAWHKTGKVWAKIRCARTGLPALQVGRVGGFSMGRAALPCPSGVIWEPAKHPAAQSSSPWSLGSAETRGDGGCSLLPRLSYGQQGWGPAPEQFAVWLQRECTGAPCGEPAPCLEQWGRAPPVPCRTPSLLLSPLQVPHGRVLRRGQHEGGRRGL